MNPIEILQAFAFKEGGTVEEILADLSLSSGSKKRCFCPTKKRGFLTKTAKMTNLHFNQ